MIEIKPVLRGNPLIAHFPTMEIEFIPDDPKESAISIRRRILANEFSEKEAAFLIGRLKEMQEEIKKQITWLNCD